MARSIFKSLIGLPALILFCLPAVAHDRHALNGAWHLIPTSSIYNGQPMMQSGTLTIGYRDRNIYIARNYVYDGKTVTVSYHSSLDGRENSSIHQGAAFKTKAKWDGDELLVTTTQNGIRSAEVYRLNPDGTLTVTTESPDHPPVTLVFERG